MNLKEFKSKKRLASKVIRALQDGVAPKGVACYTAESSPEGVIDEAVLNNPTWHPNDIYFPGYYPRENIDDNPIKPTDHIGLILGITEGPGVHKIEYHGMNDFPDSFTKGVRRKFQAKENCVMATLDNRLLGGNAGIYWFKKQKSGSLKYQKWEKIGSADDIPGLPLG